MIGSLLAIFILLNCVLLLCQLHTGEAVAASASILEIHNFEVYQQSACIVQLVQGVLIIRSERVD